MMIVKSPLLAIPVRIASARRHYVFRWVSADLGGSCDLRVHRMMILLTRKKEERGG